MIELNSTSSSTTSQSECEYQILLADLGLSCILQPNQQEQWFGGVLGSSLYMHPETWRGICGPSGDIFAFGICLLELSTGFTPLQISLKDPRELHLWDDNQLRIHAREFTEKHFSALNYNPQFIQNLYNHCLFT